MSPPTGLSGPPPGRLGRALALARWQRAAGPYWPYVCAAPLLGTDLAPVPAGLPRVPRVIHRALSRVRADERMAIFIDLPPGPSLAATPLLRGHGFHVVPVIQRWGAAAAVLRSDLLLHWLVTFAPSAPWPPAAGGVAFLLDGDRRGAGSRPGRSMLDRPQRGLRRFDNRYAYPLCRFPPPAFLRAHGITAVRWISRSGIARDLVAYAEQLDPAGLRPQE